MQMQVQLKYKPEQIVYRYCSQHILSLIFSSTLAVTCIVYVANTYFAPSHKVKSLNLFFFFVWVRASKNKAVYKHHHKLWRTEEGVIWRRRKLFSSQGTQFMTKSGFEIMKCFHFFFSLSGRAFVV